MFLGAIISRKRLRMKLEKIKVIRNWLILKIIKEVQAFLGFINYY